jgi:hypothetical protein
MKENNDPNDSSDTESSDMFVELFNENVRKMNLKSGFIFKVPTDLEREPIVYKKCAQFY